MNQANFVFTPSAEKPDIIKNVHLQEFMINSNTDWIPLHNTSHEVITIPPNTILGQATELNEYEIAQPDSLDLEIDSVTIYCEDNIELDNPLDFLYEYSQTIATECAVSTVETDIKNTDRRELLKNVTKLMVAEDPQINEIEETFSSSSENEILNQREQSIVEFDKEVKTYTPRQQEFLTSFKEVFLKGHAFEHEGADIPGVKLPTKSSKLTPTSNLAKRKYTSKDLDVIDKFIENSLNSKLICRIQSPTTSALHVVYRNGKPRVVSDLREVNHLNAGAFAYVFPRPTECINEITGKGYTCYSQVDLTGAFTQIPLDPDSYPLLAFTAMTKKYTETFAYRFLNFGYKCAPAIFSSILSTILHNINTPDVLGTIINYFDDIGAASKNEEEHYKLLSRLLSRFVKYRIKLNLKKSRFFKDSIEFCSYLVSST